MTNYKSRKHCLLLYPEDSSHMSAISYIEQNYSYAYILHDKDINQETGEIKKPHYHVIISFNSAKWRSALSKELNISENYIQNCNNYEKALEYLIHYNEELKHQYDIGEVKGNLKQKLVNFLARDGRDENEKAFELIGFIYNYNGYLSIKEFSLHCASVGMWSEFRRSSSIYMRMIDEHNLIYKNKNRS